MPLNLVNQIARFILRWAVDLRIDKAHSKVNKIELIDMQNTQDIHQDS
jgi:hypothetical protein